MRKAHALNAAIVAVAVILGVMLSLKPWRVYEQQRQVTERQVREMRESETRRAELLRQEARASSGIGREEIARQQGWRKPNEKQVSGP